MFRFLLPESYGGRMIRVEGSPPKVGERVLLVVGEEEVAMFVHDVVSTYIIEGDPVPSDNVDIIVRLEWRP